MPKSVKDRPATAVEYVFLLSKSRWYYWDPGAVRMRVSGTAHSRGDGVNPKAAKVPSGWDTADGSHRSLNGRYRPKQNASMSAAIAGLGPGQRNRRNADWFFESWQGLLLDEQDDPLALVVNPAPYAGAHYATFPPKLVEPMLEASTRAGDVVLDPFAGAGTVGLVADRYGRHAVLCELKPDYALQANGRLVGDAPLFVEVT
jgi:site-specific DNA-methyltransferase (cytosine-N4-specific)